VAEQRTFQLPGGGLKCEVCGEALPNVYRTRPSGGFILRERICPKCGEVNKTAERVINTQDRRH
jgi:transcriptional regulator NrdR family protein